MDISYSFPRSRWTNFINIINRKNTYTLSRIPWKHLNIYFRNELCRPSLAEVKARSTSANTFQNFYFLNKILTKTKLILLNICYRLPQDRLSSLCNCSLITYHRIAGALFHRKFSKKIHEVIVQLSSLSYPILFILQKNFSRA